jgi:hypothetical protein
VTFFEDGDGSRQVFTEQLALLNGTQSDAGTLSRNNGTAAHFERIDGVLEQG